MESCSDTYIRVVPLAIFDMNPKVDEFLKKAKTWKEEFGKLRAIALSCDLTEELKWGVPCYTSRGKNIILIHGFRDYCAVLFPKGSLLKDPYGILVQQTENMQAARQIRFTSLTEINNAEDAVKEYINEAIEVEKKGLKIEHKKTSEYSVPEEFERKLEQMPELKAAFEALTPGRQRAYLFYFSAPKQSKTREGRVEKYLEKIMNGKGMYD